MGQFRRRPGEKQTYFVVDEPAALVWGGELRRAGVAPRDVPDGQPAPADVRADRPDPGHRTSWDDVLTLSRLHRTTVEHLGVVALPKVTGRRGIQIWIRMDQRHRARC